MKVDELRVLEADELDVRMKTARRELYELRFKHAVGQLDNTSAITRVRRDIAKIMTVRQERFLGIVAPVAATEDEALAPAGEGAVVAEAASAAAEEPAKPRRGRKKAEDEA